MNYKKNAADTYKKFSVLEGNQHIAGDYAIENILELIKDFRIKNILEIGLGIGSISDAILNFSKDNSLEIKYYGTEANKFCLEALKKNVTDFDKIHLFPDLESLKTDTKFDLVIVDGSDESLAKVKHLLAPRSLIFIEGGRASQIEFLQELFPEFIYAEIISIRKPPEYGPFNQKWTGGGSLVFTNPNFVQKCYCFNEKVKTFLKRRARKFIKR
jgi:hypothetical protein